MSALFIDQRAYPLFALLFGFGLATMVNRRMASGIDAYCQQLTGGLRAPSAAELDQAREQAAVDARRLVRRRGLWMVLFGLIHGAFFPSEIIGTYGIVAVVFAGWFAHKHHKRSWRCAPWFFCPSSCRWSWPCSLVPAVKRLPPARRLRHLPEQVSPWPQRCPGS